MLCTMTLTACGTTQTIEATPLPPTAGIGKIVVGAYVPCSKDDIIPFAAPDPDHADVGETAANIFDTPDTISAIRRHNAEHREACGK